MKRNFVLALTTIFIGLIGSATAHSGEALVAVAANFSAAAERIQIDFENSHDHKIKLVSGSTGKLYAQIVNGAPFDVFLAADSARPERLEAEGHAVAGSRFTYALGRLVLWTAGSKLESSNGIEVLKAGMFRRLAIANPELAPYGVAAIQFLDDANLYEALNEKIVMAENVGQAFALVASGNAELGLVSLSYARSAAGTKLGSVWQVPDEQYDPIRQDAVLVKRAKENEAAKSFMMFLHSDRAKSVIKELGYGVQ